MYERYYGLQERPFDLSPNPRFLFLSKRHREALTSSGRGVRTHVRTGRSRWNRPENLLICLK